MMRPSCLLALFCATTVYAATTPLCSDGWVAEKTGGYDTDIHVTPAEVARFRFMAQYAGAAYCNSNATAGSPVVCSNNVCPAVTADGAVVIASFGGDSNITSSSSNTTTTSTCSNGTNTNPSGLDEDDNYDELVTDMAGFVAADPSRALIVLAFRGSATLRNWFADLIFVQVPCDTAFASGPSPDAPSSPAATGCLVHAGFAAAWTAVRPAALAGLARARALHPTYALAVTGHSLGAAVATLAAAHLRRREGVACDLYTYGSPRVGNEVLVELVTSPSSSPSLGSTYRITHLDDPVPRLPPLFLGYRHTSPEYWLSGGTATTTDYDARDVRVCTGTANTSCDGGGEVSAATTTTGGGTGSAFSFDPEAHDYYFEDIAGCDGPGLPFRVKRESSGGSSNNCSGGNNSSRSSSSGDADSGGDVDDRQLAERLGAYAALDQAYADALANGSSCS